MPKKIAATVVTPAAPAAEVETPATVPAPAKKQYHLAVSQSFKLYVAATAATFSGPSPSKDDLAMNEREFCDAVHALCEANPELLEIECKRTLAMRAPRERKSATVAEVESLKARNAKLVERLQAAGMTEAEIEALIAG